MCVGYMDVCVYFWMSVCLSVYMYVCFCSCMCKCCYGNENGCLDLGLFLRISACVCNSNCVSVYVSVYRLNHLLAVVPLFHTVCRVSSSSPDPVSRTGWPQ